MTISSSEKHLIFGYGTFITKKFYKRYDDVKSAFLPGYYRVTPPGYWYPFVIKDNGAYPHIKSGFWGLVFKVDENGLKRLDIYEGEGDLYSRVKVDIIYSDGAKGVAELYYPTERSIKETNLYSLIPEGDKWRERIIQKHPDIIKEFPELAYSSFKSP
ncbi:MAG: gamma-glutamylcyclotransferase family protein [Promethearchaeota archaeon]